MQKKVKDRVAKREERKLKREEGTIFQRIRAVNQQYNIDEGKPPNARVAMRTRTASK